MYHGYYGDDFKVELPTGSGNYATLEEVAEEISSRLIKMFAQGNDGNFILFLLFYQDTVLIYFICFYR